MESLPVRQGGPCAAGQLEVALAELGVLAAVTDARREYLQDVFVPRDKLKEKETDRMLYKWLREEQRKLQKSQHLPQEQQTGGQQPQQQKLASLALDDYRYWDAEHSGPVLSLAQSDMKMFPSTSRTRQLFMPYNRGARQLQQRPITFCSLRSAGDAPVQRHRSVPLHCHNLLHHPHAAVAGGYASSFGPHLSTLQPPGPRQQNKSNPSSPVKSGSLFVGVEGADGLRGFGTPLVRSKSLDNISLSPLTATVVDEPFVMGETFTGPAGPSRISRVDTIVESVSSRISSLQLTAN